MSCYSSFEYCSSPDTSSVSLTNVFIQCHDGGLYRVIKREEMLFEAFMAFQNIRIVKQYENNGALSFTGVPGK